MRPFSAVVVLALAHGLPAIAAVPPADLVLLRGRVYTQDPAKPWAQALAIRGGRLVAVGTDGEARGFAGPRTRVVDLGGKTVLPGFHDAHVHPIAAGVELGQCYLVGAGSEREIVGRVKAYARTQPGRRWIVGSGWDLTLFSGASPHKRVLDAVVPDRPVALWSADGHSVWANSIALRLAGIGRGMPDPPAGRIERDPRTGEPTGTLRESAAEIVGALVPAPGKQELERALSRAQDILASHGIVSVFEASAGKDFLETYAAAARAGKLKLRVRAAMSWAEAEAAGGAIATLLAWQKRYRAPGFSPDAVKLFVDGVVEARTAALLEPYLLNGAPATGGDSLGKPGFTAERLGAIVADLDRAGLQVHMHAIGDGAVRMGLDAIAAAQGAGGRRDARHVLAHLEMIDRADLPRFGALGAVAAIQPLWAYRDDYIENLTVPVLGPERTNRVYPFGSLARAGAALAGGSDWSVSSPSPLEAIQVAVTRQSPDAQSAGGAVLGAAEKLTLSQAIGAYTLGGARAGFEEDGSGAIVAGKWADLVVLDRNPFEVPLRQVGRIRVLWTLCAGRGIWGSAPLYIKR